MRRDVNHLYRVVVCLTPEQQRWWGVFAGMAVCHAALLFLLAGNVSPPQVTPIELMGTWVDANEPTPPAPTPPAPPAKPTAPSARPAPSATPAPTSTPSTRTLAAAVPAAQATLAQPQEATQAPTAVTELASAVAVRTAPSANAQSATGAAVSGSTHTTVAHSAPRVQLPSTDADYLHNPAPVYPPQSKRMGEQGRVVHNVVIGSDGLPQSARLVHSSGFSRLDQAAYVAVMRWRYVPGKRNGVPVTMSFDVPMIWVLD